MGAEKQECEKVSEDGRKHKPRTERQGKRVDLSSLQEVTLPHLRRGRAVPGKTTHSEFTGETGNFAPSFWTFSLDPSLPGPHRCPLLPLPPLRTPRPHRCPGAHAAPGGGRAGRAAYLPGRQRRRRERPSEGAAGAEPAVLSHPARLPPGLVREARVLAATCQTGKSEGAQESAGPPAPPPGYKSWGPEIQ